MLQIRKGFATLEKDINHKTWQVAVPEDRKRKFSAKYVEARGIRLRGCARATNTGLYCTDVPFCTLFHVTLIFRDRDRLTTHLRNSIVFLAERVSPTGLRAV